MFQGLHPQVFTAPGRVGLRHFHQLALSQHQAKPRPEAPQHLQGGTRQAGSFLSVSHHALRELAVILPRPFPDFLRLVLGLHRLRLAQPDLAVLRIADPVGQAAVSGLGGVVHPTTACLVLRDLRRLLRFRIRHQPGLHHGPIGGAGLPSSGRLPLRRQQARGMGSGQGGLAAGDRRHGLLKPA